MVWWLWLLLGLILLGAEMATPGGFYVIFFGTAALLVGALGAFEVVVSPIAQWLLFSVVSIASLVLFRRRLLAAFETPPRREATDALRGEVAVLGEALAPGAIGKAELRGTSWTVCNSDSRPLRAGERCRVERVDGLTLMIRGETS
jgi:membrane protein implicated in regulation of membrane protease activity